MRPRAASARSRLSASETCRRRSPEALDRAGEGWSICPGGGGLKPGLPPWRGTMLQFREPLLRSASHGDWVEFSAAGPWTAEPAREIEPLVEQAEREPLSVRAVGIDMSRVERIDTFGAWLLERMVRAFRAAGCQIKVVGLSEHYGALIEELHQVNLKPPRAVRTESRLEAALAMVGRTMVEIWNDLADFARLLGELILVIARVVSRPLTFRLTSTVHQLERVAWGAVPIVLLITFLIGAILAQQGIFHFRKF